MIEITKHIVYLQIPTIFPIGVDLILNRFVERQIRELENNLREIEERNPNVGTTVIIQGQLDRNNQANFLSSIRIVVAPSGDDIIDK